jgi:GNAT superfamily N-acetyltransferase
MALPLPDSITMVPFEPSTASAEEWARYHAYRRQRRDESRPDDPLLPDEMVERTMARVEPFTESRRWAVLDGDTMIGQLWADWFTPDAPGYDSNARFIYTDAGVLGAYRRRGIGTALARQLLAWMQDVDKSLLTTWTEEDDGYAFLDWLGAERKLTGAENRLHLGDVDWDMVARWVAEGQARNPDTRLVFHEHRVPEAERSEFAQAIGSLLNTMPFDDMEHGEIVVTVDTIADQYARMDDMQASHHVYLTREPDGSISGMTDIGYVPARADRVNQRFTGVRPDCRGRGLGKWIKAAMLQYIRETYPDAEWMTTGNANSNDPMLAINRRLGFQTYKGSTTFQMSRDALAARLDKAAP